MFSLARYVAMLRTSIRGVFIHKLRSMLTVLGLAFALGVVIFMLAFSRSLAATARHTGDADNWVILSKRAQTHVLSAITTNDCDRIRLEDPESEHHEQHDCSRGRDRGDPRDQNRGNSRRPSSDDETRHHDHRSNPQP